MADEIKCNSTEVIRHYSVRVYADGYRDVRVDGVNIIFTDGLFMNVHVPPEDNVTTSVDRRARWRIYALIAAEIERLEKEQVK